MQILEEEDSGQSIKKAKHIAARNMLKRLLDESHLIEDQAPILACLKKCDEEDVAEDIAAAKQQVKQAAKECEKNPDNAPVSSATSGQVIEAKSSSLVASTGSESHETNPIVKLQEICMKMN